MKVLSLKTVQPFNWSESICFLDRGYDESLFHIEEGRVFRAIRVNDKLIPFSVTNKDDLLLIQLPLQVSTFEEKKVISYISEWFDLKRDIDPFYRLLNATPILSTLSESYYGLRLIGIPDLFEAMCWSIIGQQINLTFAFKLKRKLVVLYGESIQWQGHTLYHFPTPEALVNLDEDLLKTQQFSRGKIQYLKNVALAFLEDGLNKSVLAGIPDFETRQKQLTKIKGIGIWSANYALMKTLHQPEAIPFGDTGLTQALFNLKIIEDRKDEKAIVKFFKTMQNWEAYTVFYLWRSLSN